ncbi:hypothetical protein ABMA28_011464 [Loxostege sticticalis]|uniref:Uncharacterized protein n=1 Tax=Loxostege sticticalis TaxID=481309 RepID=A0ABD0S598_LOXSC
MKLLVVFAVAFVATASALTEHFDWDKFIAAYHDPDLDPEEFKQLLILMFGPDMGGTIDGGFGPPPEDGPAFWPPPVEPPAFLDPELEPRPVTIYPPGMEPKPAPLPTPVEPPYSPPSHEFASGEEPWAGSRPTIPEDQFRPIYPPGMEPKPVPVPPTYPPGMEPKPVPLPPIYPPGMEPKPVEIPNPEDLVVAPVSASQLPEAPIVAPGLAPSLPEAPVVAPGFLPEAPVAAPALIPSPAASPLVQITLNLAAAAQPAPAGVPEQPIIDHMVRPDIVPRPWI